MVVFVFFARQVLVLIRSIDGIRFTRLATFDLAKFVPRLCQVPKLELLPSSKLAARKLGRNMFSTNSSSNACQIQTWHAK